MTVKEYMSRGFLILDGGMGTLLQERGLAPGERPERWNLTHPDEIRAIHRAYYEAGSNVVAANTFGANPLRFSREELDGIVSSALANAKAARAEARIDHPAWVALDLGPTGRLLRPYGDLDFEDAVAAFAETVRLGVRYGADLILIETMSDSYETKAALLAAKENSDLPIFVSCAFGKDGKLMTGADPAAMVALLEGMGADAVGLNCSEGPAAMLPTLAAFLDRASVPVLFKPNAGLPRSEGGVAVYDLSPEDFASAMGKAADAGARILGGCCGTTPAYIAALCRALDGRSPRPLTKKRRSSVSSYTHATDFGDFPILIGERLNPTGKPRLKEALRNRETDYLLSEGIRQQEAGADLLDVNVGLPGIAESEVLPEVVCALQEVSDLPLALDTANPDAMEAALRRYNGKALVNSVNGRKEVMRRIFPIVRKYGGLMIALTLDERGIPETADERVEIARRILKVGAEYGFSEEDFLFDPLAVPVSASPDAGRVTLEAVQRIRRELGCRTSLGLSNISYGLPDREAINSSFLAMALASGLSAAICNPLSLPLRRTMLACRMLSGQDPECREFIAFATGHPLAENAAAQTKTEGKTAASPAEDSLRAAILSGRKERAAALTRELLATSDPLAVIREQIIPALDEVGRGYESGRVYLPGLLISAEAATAAFAVIRSAAGRQESADGMPIVLATVEGDVHDIGKNIVRLLLENYGFRVIDLGKDVPPERVAEAAKRAAAPLVGLSALMTTTLPAMEKTVALLRRECPGCRVMVGGAVVTQSYADSIGADAYGRDAMAAVRYAEEVDSSRKT